MIFIRLFLLIIILEICTCQLFTLQKRIELKLKKINDRNGQKHDSIQEVPKMHAK